MSLFKKAEQKRVNSREPRKTEAPVTQDTQRRGAKRQQVATLTMSTLVSLHKQVGKEAFLRLMKTPVSSLLNCLLIAVAFALPALLYVLVANIQQLGSAWDGQPRISVYLNQNSSQKTIDQLVRDYRAHSLIETVEFISPEQGLQDFQSKAGLQGVISHLGFNPLPAVIQLTPNKKDSFQALDEAITQFQKMIGVEEVRLDRQWVQRLQAILAMLEQFSLMLGGILGLTVVLVISNTVRLNIESRRDEIKIVSMVGGTRGFISMPFIYMGLWYGVTGALLAQIIVLVLIAVLGSQMAELAGLYSSNMSLFGPGLDVFGTLLLAGILLGVIGAMASCYRHFQGFVPE
ncbi:permease-like cell division protein FtsX [Endozoicomonas ascidiicola]|uniref:permease-like cell division protein FtsX n=1 Tax=Endozoicomonas ascidiicola TaxID=1698521 RepID=UPI00082B8C0A|nr:permease-like cell division protein FtsX [Endozoicomonas ascidiicola]